MSYVKINQSQTAWFFLLKKNKIDNIFAALESSYSNSNKIYKWVKKILPNYMIPKDIIFYKKFYFNKNGKIMTEQELLWIVVTKLIFDQMPQIIKDILPLKVPMLIWIDPTNMCNFKCVFCPTGDDELLKSVSRPKGMMNMKTYNKIIDDLKLMVDKYSQKPLQISLYKDGEPLLNKNLVEMVKILKKQKSLIVLK